MQEIGKLKFKRVMVPDEAVSLGLITIDTADASNKVACAAKYSKFLRKCGKYSCLLIFSRSRAELLPAPMTVHTDDIVRR